MNISKYIYHLHDEEFHGLRAYNAASMYSLPTVLIVHDWSGCGEFVVNKAQELAKLGYLGFAVDMYGDGKTGETTEEKSALMQPLINDRAILRARIIAALDAVAAMPEVDPQRIAIIGYCFGGLCALDLARSGAALCGAVSFHGLLNKPNALDNASIKAKILALHGYDDPMVLPAAVQDFCAEMTVAHVDWQMHVYGNTQHAFSNPKANDIAAGIVYNSVADKRSWLAMLNFLHEIFL